MRGGVEESFECRNLARKALVHGDSMSCPPASFFASLWQVAIPHFRIVSVALMNLL